jgi:hypothetical protein
MMLPLILAPPGTSMTGAARAEAGNGPLRHRLFDLVDGHGFGARGVALAAPSAPTALACFIAVLAAAVLWQASPASNGV